MSDSHNFVHNFNVLENIDWDQFWNDEFVDGTEEQAIFALIEDIEQLEQASSSRRRRRKNVQRDREDGHQRIMRDYFAVQPVYDDQSFRERFRMRRPLFLRIVDALGNHSEYFQQWYDAAKVKGLSPLQKCTAAMRMLAHGMPAVVVDEYVQIGKQTALDCLFNFCQFVVEVFGPRYLRKPGPEDVERLLKMHEDYHGFPGMLGSLDCMHWEWRNCPVAWKGMFTRGDHGVPTIVLEAVASTDLWIWHAFFGASGAQNDLNVLYQSTLFQEVFQDQAPEVRFEVNGTEYKQGYYLTDGIYPEWGVFVKSFPRPYDPKRKKFKQKQESARKDIERAFGVLQARFAIISGPARPWEMNNLKDIMYACIILHNMSIEDERTTFRGYWPRNDHSVAASQGPTPSFQRYLQLHSQICDRDIHHNLRADLVEHIWAKFGGQ